MAREEEAIANLYDSHVTGSHNHVHLKILQAYPIVCRWLMHLGNLIMLVSLVWLHYSLGGFGLFLQLGMTSFFAVIWCSIFSVHVMIGIWKFLTIMVSYAPVALAQNLFSWLVVYLELHFLWALLKPGTLGIAISATVSLWICGSFWTTGLVIVVGADRNAGEPSSTGSGSEIELTSEEEVGRMLNSSDLYSALVLARYENIDMSSLKCEYSKKAMLVHPDKNMRDEKAVEAFEKLQNAYEVLLDSLKRLKVRLRWYF
ncbi:uncharacterized protein LOC113326845 [Papaver somniferum]|uniref:uncharacterized protein LOC113326845 n=1 Tax=Papaver somniferum TaxID=3469 RepID=UPI000E6F8ECC|nr:uncharacterized protein LOC113326845 [Papaver somniferum]